VKIYFSLVVNNPPSRTFIFVEVDSKETNVNTAAANIMPLTSDLTDSAESATPDKAFAGNAELEELAGLFHDHHKMIFRIAYRVTGSQSDAEDVLQNVFGVAPAARNAISNAKNRFMIIAKKTGEFFELRVPRERFVWRRAFCVVFKIAF
jgi:hypothetical protein